MRPASSLLLAFALALSLSSLAISGCATSGDTEYGEELDETAGSPGKLGLWQAADGRFHFQLAAASGTVLLVSEAYESRAGAVGGILSVLHNGVDPARYEVVPEGKGYLLRLVAENREAIAVSEVHATEWSARRAIASAVSAITAYLDRRAAATGARIEVTGEDAGFRFRVHGGGGELLLSSESYTAEAAAYNGAIAAQLAGRTRAGYEVRQAAAGGFYFVVQAGNGEVVGTSARFEARERAEAAVASLIAVLSTVAVF